MPRWFSTKHPGNWHASVFFHKTPRRTFRHMQHHVISQIQVCHQTFRPLSYIGALASTLWSCHVSGNTSSDNIIYRVMMSQNHKVTTYGSLWHCEITWLRSQSCSTGAVTTLWHVRGRFTPTWRHPYWVPRTLDSKSRVLCSAAKDTCSYEVEGFQLLRTLERDCRIGAV